MQKRQTRKTSGLLLLSTALLQFTLLIISMATSFFFPVGDNTRPDWSSYLIALVCLGIAFIGGYQIRTSREPIPLSQPVSVPLGLILGIVLAIVLYVPSQWRIWIVLGWSIVWVTSSCICADQVARRSGSVQQGFWSSVLVTLVASLGTTLMFSFLDSLAFFFFHTGSGLVAPSSFHGFSSLANYLAYYQGAIQLLAILLLVLTIVGLPLAFVSAFISRHTSARPTFAQADQAEPGDGER